MLSADAERAKPFWGAINAAVSQGADTAALWQAIRAESQRLGPEFPRPTLRGVSALRGLAVREREAARAFGRAPAENAMTANLAPQSIRARDLEDQAIFPKYQANFQLTHQLPSGKVETVWRSVIMDVIPDMTVGQVYEKTLTGAQALSARYQTTFLGVGEVRVSTI